MRVAVAGGTGVVGRHVVRALVDSGHEPVVLARSKGVDLLTGGGVAEALEGVDATVDVTNVTTTRRSVAVGFFEATSTHLLTAGRAVGVRHHVVLSIVGVDRVALGYYQGKLRQEELALSGPVPATILRATQFHEFPGQMLDRVKGPVAVVPRMRVRPVAAREVGAALADLACRAPEGMAADMAGPQEHEFVDLAKQVARARGSRRPVIGVRLPGRAGRAMADGALLPTGACREGEQAFDQWLGDAAGSGQL